MIKYKIRQWLAITALLVFGINNPSSELRGNIQNTKGSVSEVEALQAIVKHLNSIVTLTAPRVEPKTLSGQPINKSIEIESQEKLPPRPITSSESNNSLGNPPREAREKKEGIKGSVSEIEALQAIVKHLNSIVTLAASKVEPETLSVPPIKFKDQGESAKKASLSDKANLGNPPRKARKGKEKVSQKTTSTLTTTRETGKKNITQILPTQTDLQLQKRNWFCILQNLKSAVQAKLSEDFIKNKLNSLEELLQESPILINAATKKNQETALHLVASSASDKVCETAVNLLLKQEEIDVNAVNKQGHTALYLAALQRNEAYTDNKGYKEAVELLLKKGAVPSKVEMEEITKKKKKMQWLIDLLKKHVKKHPLQGEPIKKLLQDAKLL